MKHRRFRLAVWLPLLAVLALIASALNVAVAASGSVGQSQAHKYTVEFVALGLDVLPPAAKAAIVEAMNAWPDQPPANDTFYAVHVRWETTWAIVTLTSANLKSPLAEGETSHLNPNNLIALLLAKTDQGWQAAIDVDERVNGLLALAPESELSQSARRAIFAPAAQIRQTSPLQQYASYKFPWPTGYPWRRTRTTDIWHGSAGRSLDFDIKSPETNSDILAAAPGTVTSMCRGSADQYYVLIRTEGTTESLGYLHLDGATVRQEGINVGTSVVQGEKLGRMRYADNVEGVSDNCGTSYGTHVHLDFPEKPFTLDGITFSDSNVHSGEDLYSTQGVAPVGYIDAPAPGSPRTGTVRIEGWSKVDGSTIARVEIWIDGINRGNATYGTPRPDAGGNYGYYWDWNTAQYSDGSHTIQVQAVANSNTTAWLLAASNSQPSLSVTTDNTPPSNPSSISPGCAASNNVWQNTCADPNFTWNGASDGNGSGVKDYHYYWGPSASGTPNTYTSAAGFDPPAVSGPVAARYLRIATRDNLNQESPASMVFGFLYDASAPTATVQINHGAASANQVDVTLNLTASDLGSGVSEMCVSSNGIGCTNWQPLAAELPWTLPAINRRAATVYAQVRDRAGNLSGAASASIYLDLYPVAPHSPGYRICQDVMNVGGSTRITSTHYLLSSAIGQPTASGAISTTSGSFRGQSGFLANLTGCLPITYTATSNYTLTQWVIASAGNVRGSTSYRLGDTAGQALASGAAVFSSTTYRMSSGFWAAITATIPTTTTPPTPIPTTTPTPTPIPGPIATPQPTSFGVTINDGGLYTNNSQVTVRAWAPNVIQTMLSNDGGFLNASWQTYQLTYTWVMSTYGNTSMPRLVYVRFRDGANTEYGTYFDDIVYDPVAPQGSVSILGGETQTVTLWLEGQDDYSGVADVRLSENPQALEGAVWQAYTNLVEWPLVGNVVYAQFRDKAGNRSPIYASDGTTYNPNAKKVYLPLILK